MIFWPSPVHSSTFKVQHVYVKSSHIIALMLLNCCQSYTTVNYLLGKKGKIYRQHKHCYGNITAQKSNCKITTSIHWLKMFLIVCVWQELVRTNTYRWQTQNQESPLRNETLVSHWDTVSSCTPLFSSTVTDCRSLSQIINKKQDRSPQYRALWRLDSLLSHP